MEESGGEWHCVELLGPWAGREHLDVVGVESVGLGVACCHMRDGAVLISLGSGSGFPST